MYFYSCRITQTLSLERNRHQIPMTACARRSVCGILGILELISGPHLAVIVAKSKVEDQFYFFLERKPDE